MTENDDVATLRLLWRSHADETPPRPGPKKKITVDEAVDAAIGLADEQGLNAVSMRALATRLGIGAMSLYTYVANREQLLQLMVDQAMGRTTLAAHPGPLRERMRQVAMLTYDEVRRHPWLPAAVGVVPVMGPHTSARYEWQLEALEDHGMDDIEMDQTVALLVGFATNAARSAHAQQISAQKADTAWWESVAPVLAEVATEGDFPLSSRVGSASGLEYGAAADVDREFSFGLDRILDGLEALVRERG